MAASSFASNPSSVSPNKNATSKTVGNMPQISVMDGQQKQLSATGGGRAAILPGDIKNQSLNSQTQAKFD